MYSGWIKRALIRIGILQTYKITWLNGAEQSGYLLGNKRLGYIRRIVNKTDDA